MARFLKRICNVEGLDFSGIFRSLEFSGGFSGLWL